MENTTESRERRERRELRISRDSRDETSAVVKLAPHERVQQRTLGQVVGVPVVSQRPHGPEGSKRSGVCTQVQNDRIVEVLVVLRRQGRTFRTEEKTLNVTGTPTCCDAATDASDSEGAHCA